MFISNRFLHGLTLAFRAFHPATPLPPRVILAPRPAWDNGTNYDVPTFLRRRFKSANSSRACS